MKLFPAVFFVMPAFFFFSCSNNTEEKAQGSGFETLKAESDFISSKITWTEELEGGRLTGKVKTGGLGNKVKASALSVSAGKKENPSFVYPSLPGFGSLDTTLIPLNLRPVIENFCGLFSSDGDFSSFVRTESLADIALFYYDLNSYLPEYSDFFSTKEEKTSDESKEEGSKTENADKKFFDSYKLGEPFIDGVNYDVPILFRSGNKILTLETYWTLENSKWLLDQIQITAVETSSGEKY